MAKDKEEGKSSTSKPKASKAPQESRESSREGSKEAGKATKPKAHAAAEGVEAKAKKPAKKPAGPARAKLSPKTYFAKPGELGQDWKVVDAAGQTLGRLSSQVASMLMGKNKPTYTRSSDTGDFVIVINAEKVVLTGKKLTDKVYQYHTNYPGGLKTQTAQEILEKHPDRLIKNAVYGMLPKGHMGRHWYKKLRVFAGSEHPHAAQQPVTVTLAESAVKERI